MTALKPNCRGASSSLIIMVRPNYSTLPKAAARGACATGSDDTHTESDAMWPEVTEVKNKNPVGRKVVRPSQTGWTSSCASELEKRLLNHTSVGTLQDVLFEQLLLDFNSKTWNEQLFPQPGKPRSHSWKITCTNPIFTTWMRYCTASVWTCRSCQASSPMAWGWGYGGGGEKVH